MDVSSHHPARKMERGREGERERGREGERERGRGGRMREIQTVPLMEMHFQNCKSMLPKLLPVSTPVIGCVNVYASNNKVFK